MILADDRQFSIIPVMEEISSDDLIDRLREEMSSHIRPESVADELIATLGTAAVRKLRRRYFPHWRAGTVLQRDPSMRMFRKVVVRDEIERAIVESVAPDDVRYTVEIVDSDREPSAV